MRLAEMNPKWEELLNWAAKDRPFYVGLSFDCPCDKCNKDSCPTCGHKERSQRFHLKFWPPIDPTKVGETFDFTRIHHTHGPGGPMVFDREGDTFEQLTFEQHMCIDGHWAGKIINGELVTSL
jgi:hypothetical protein